MDYILETKPDLAYLAHHGVKGMKWGVRKEYQRKGRQRRTRNKGSSPTKSPLSQKVSSPFKKAGMMAAVGVHPSSIGNPGKLFVKPEIAKKEDVIFRKGSIVQHVMATPDKDLDRHLFVAATPEDKANYAGFFAALSSYRNNNAQMYKMELRAKEALVSPGKKKRVEEFLKLYESDKVNISRELAEFNKREYGGYFKKDVEHYAKQFENMSMRELKGKGYYTFYNSLFSSDYNRNAYFNRLKEQGYTAVVDDNDKRSFMQAKAPLIIFNAYDSLEKVSVSEISKEEIKQNMVDWSKMKHDAFNEKPDLEYIAHYGVKGMKWGVRKKRHLHGPLHVYRERKRKTEEEKRKIAEKKAREQAAWNKALRYIESDKYMEKMRKKYKYLDLDSAELSNDRKAIDNFYDFLDESNADLSRLYEKYLKEG